MNFSRITLTSTLLALLHTPSFAQDSTPNTETEANESQSNSAEVLETVHVIGKRQGNYTIITEDAQKLVEMPGALGDPLGAISALPGVITPADGGAPAVRGSSPEDNRYFIDGMPAGYIFHAFNTSIIDENIIQDFQLYSAGFGAQYANTTGAVFDIRLRDPEQTDFTTTITASLLRAGVLLESELTENSAFYFSLRQGLLQLFLPEDDEPNEDGIRIKSAPTDGDYVFKYLWSKTPGHRLTINLIGASDKAEAEFFESSSIAEQNPDFAGDAKLDDNFNSQSISWDYTLDSGIEFHVIAAHYTGKDNLYWGNKAYFNDLVLDDSLLKISTVVPVSDAHTLTIGTELDQYDFEYRARQPLFVCTEFDPDCQDSRGDIIDVLLDLTIQQTMFFAIDQWQINDKLLLETGLQWNTNDHTNNDFVHPRASLHWELNDNLAFITSAGTYDRLPDITYTLEEIGNPKLESYRAKHYTLGFEGNLYDNWTWTLEGYHKDLTYLPLALDENQPDADLHYVNGTEGEAQGIDLFLNRNLANNWYGWVSLSYSQSTRTNIRTQKTTDYTLDTPIVFNAVANYQFSELWDAGFRFTAKSGEANTEIIGIKENPDFPGNYLPEYGEPYADRLPNYARLDFRVRRTLEWFGHDGAFFVDVLNLLNRQNVSEVELDYEKVQETGELHIVKDAELEMFVSLGVSFTF